MNYLRDRASAIVTLQWDLVALDSPNQPLGPEMEAVSIANNGRRPLYIKLVYLDISKRSGYGPMILRRSLNGQKIGEGDPEFVIPLVDQNSLQKFAAYWKDIYAVAVDNCGHKYKSKAPKKQPAWAQPTPASP